MRNRVKYLFIIFCLFAIGAASAQEQMVVACYNVANMMDVYNDPLTHDDDLLPNADREWTTERYKHKISSVSRVICDISHQHDFPVLMALCEVENRLVLEDLVSSHELQDVDYSYIHYDSRDERGIDVALLYRPDRFRVERSCSLPANLPQPTRDYLVVWGELCGEPLLVVMAHLPSRIGGRAFTSSQREQCAMQIRDFVDSVRSVERGRKVIIMGDMNDTPRDRSLKYNLGAELKPKSVLQGGLYNPFGRVKGRGSMVYRDRWYLYDQIILSQEFLSSGSISLVKERGCYGFIFSRPYMLNRRGYPLPTYLGVEYVGGVSDHLPVYVLLQKNGEK